MKCFSCFLNLMVLLKKMRKDLLLIQQIKKEKVKPTNFFTAGAESNVRTADFEREAYILNYVEDESARLEVTAYVDIYTGKVIGGSFKGD